MTIKTYSRFEHSASLRATTIAPSPADGKTLVEHGWRYITRDMATGEIVSERNPDEVRLAIWRGFGHNV